MISSRKNRMPCRRLSFPLAVVFCVLFNFSAPAQESTVPQSLTERQRLLGERYTRLENVLLRMAEIDAQANPRRAALLKKVLAESKERLVDLRFEELTAVLANKRFTEAIQGQETLEKDLAALLDLLESENRQKQRNDEKERIKRILKELDALIHRQRAVKGKTAGTEDPAMLEHEQREIGDAGEHLADRMAESQEIGPRPPQTADPSDAPKVSPIQQAMKQAIERIRGAEQQLRGARRDEAVLEQEEAIAKLQKARSELEKIARQLREEERMQTLLWLEARIRKMLRLEQGIQAQCRDIGGKAAPPLPDLMVDSEEERLQRTRTARLAADQKTVLQDADATILVLREDGTAAAMTETMIQARADMDDARDRFERADAGAVTQSIIQSAIDTLKEMLEAVGQAKEEAQRDKQRQQEGNPPSPEQQELVRLLSEMKMIRLMQKRINTRTEHCEALREEPGTDLVRLARQIEELARQQARIETILSDIRLEKNK